MAETANKNVLASDAVLKQAAQWIASYVTNRLNPSRITVKGYVLKKPGDKPMLLFVVHQKPIRPLLDKFPDLVREAMERVADSFEFGEPWRVLLDRPRVVAVEVHRFNPAPSSPEAPQASREPSERPKARAGERSEPGERSERTLAGGSE